MCNKYNANSTFPEVCLPSRWIYEKVKTESRIHDAVRELGSDQKSLSGQPKDLI